MLSIFASPAAMGQESNHDQPPNIIIIIPDDLGWSDVGYYGSEIKTPNIDQLAKTGIRLDQHYVMPTCTPTRVSLITGRYPSRYGVTGPDYGEVIPLSDPTLPALLKKNNYATSLVGKWHMGSPPYTPLKYGFDTSYGYLDGQIDPYTHNYKNDSQDENMRSWHRQDKYLEEKGHATDLITKEVVNKIENAGEDPYFIYVAYSVPHYPLDEPEVWKVLYDDQQLHPCRKLFAASVTHMDAGIGQIVAALERTNQREKTLILFISDNGGQKSWYSQTEYRGKYADLPHKVLGNNFPLRGWKGDLYEGGIRVPAFINWPGNINAGSTDFPIHVSDWLPTICHMSGSGLDQAVSTQLDGKNIWQYLNGENQEVPSRQFYWKTKQSYAVRDGSWKLLQSRNENQVELYDLQKDLREMNDLSKQHPDKVAQLMQLMEQYQQKDQ